MDEWTNKYTNGLTDELNRAEIIGLFGRAAHSKM